MRFDAIRLPYPILVQTTSQVASTSDVHPVLDHPIGNKDTSTALAMQACVSMRMYEERRDKAWTWYRFENRLVLVHDIGCSVDNIMNSSSHPDQ